MLSDLPFLYVPALRLKEGEYRALGRLARDVASRVAPRLVIPPPKERDPETKRQLTLDEIVHLTGRRIGSYWRLRPAFLEARFLFPEFGEIESKDWLPRIFDVARNSGAHPIPVATLDDMLGARGDAFRRVLNDRSAIRLAIRVSSGELDNSLAERIAAAISSFSISPEACAIILDFADADFSDVEAVSDIAEGALERVQDIGLWNSVVFQGTNYPEHNPAEAGSSTLVPRNEWLAWKSAVHADLGTSERLIFGDYCADSAKFQFRSGNGGAPIRHYRYCTPESWLVVRGETETPHADSMKKVCQQILDSGKFSGRDFSSADEYIYNSANGHDGPGNATTWREINTAHHITQVVADIGKIRGYNLAKHSVKDAAIQLSLLDFGSSSTHAAYPSSQTAE